MMSRNQCVVALLALAALAAAVPVRHVVSKQTMALSTIQAQVQTQVGCIGNMSCYDKFARENEGACTERCNCQFLGNVSAGKGGCVQRQGTDLTMQEHCLNVNTGGTCGGSGSVMKFTNGWAANEFHAIDIMCYPLQTGGLNKRPRCVAKALTNPPTVCQLVDEVCEFISGPVGTDADSCDNTRDQNADDFIKRFVPKFSIEAGMVTPAGGTAPDTTRTADEKFFVYNTKDLKAGNGLCTATASGNTAADTAKCADVKGKFLYTKESCESKLQGSTDTKACVYTEPTATAIYGSVNTDGSVNTADFPSAPSTGTFETGNPPNGITLVVSTFGTITDGAKFTLEHECVEEGGTALRDTFSTDEYDFETHNVIKLNPTGPASGVVITDVNGDISSDAFVVYEYGSCTDTTRRDSVACLGGCTDSAGAVTDVTADLCTGTSTFATNGGWVAASKAAECVPSDGWAAGSNAFCGALTTEITCTADVHPGTGGDETVPEKRCKYDLAASHYAVVVLKDFKTEAAAKAAGDGLSSTVSVAVSPTVVTLVSFNDDRAVGSCSATIGLTGGQQTTQNTFLGDNLNACVSKKSFDTCTPAGALNGEIVAEDAGAATPIAQVHACTWTANVLTATNGCLVGGVPVDCGTGGVCLDTATDDTSYTCQCKAPGYTGGIDVVNAAIGVDCVAVAGQCANNLAVDAALLTSGSAGNFAFTCDASAGLLLKNDASALPGATAEACCDAFTCATTTGATGTGVEPAVPFTCAAGTNIVATPAATPCDQTGVPVGGTPLVCTQAVCCVSS